MQKLQRLQQLPRKVTNTKHRKGSVIMHLQEIIQRSPQTLKHQTVMSGGEAEPIQYPRTGIISPAMLFPIHPFTDIRFNQGTVIITSDIPDNFDGNRARCASLETPPPTSHSSTAITIVPKRILSTSKTEPNPTTSATDTIVIISSRLSQIQTFHNSSKSSHSHVFDDPVPISDERSRSSAEMTNGVITRRVGASTVLTAVAIATAIASALTRAAFYAWPFRARMVMIAVSPVFMIGALTINMSVMRMVITTTTTMKSTMGRGRIGVTGIIYIPLITSTSALVAVSAMGWGRRMISTIATR